MRTIFKFLDHPHHSEKAGVDFDNVRDFLFVPVIHSAKKHIYAETVSFGIVLAVVFGVGIYWLHTALDVNVFVIISAFITFFYLALMLFKIWVVYTAVMDPAPEMHFTREEIDALKDEDLPIYTILIPLYREEEVIHQIIKAMSAIEYPPEKLDVIITLEEYDHPTIDAIKAANPPAHFKTLILPDVQPKTKPKALNVAFREIQGEYVVIYDAEIVPDPDQLKKAVLAFRANPHIGVFQTRLDHYNSEHNILTKLFNAEFSFYYDMFIPGLERLRFPMPLSGHSTHFRHEALRAIGAWDPYNVTEDCDIGIRIFRAGYRTGFIDSVSKEEATNTITSWIFQRTRWMKGFIQTSIVHLRHPFRFKNEVRGWRNFFAFLMIVPGTVLVNVLNLINWIVLVLWVTMRPSTIQALFPGPILYLAVTTFVMGNIIFVYLNLMGSYMRKRFGLVKYSLLSPFYWILLAFATTRASIQILTKPHHWEKTKHGTHLATNN